MINLADANNDNERVVLQLIKSMEDGSLPDAIEAHCTDDFVWMNSGLATVNGKQDLKAHMQAGGFANEIPILKTMSHFSADLIHMASEGDIVFTERIDHHWDADGRDLMTPHICGIAEIRGGKICAFRDFFDVACFQQAPTEPNPDFALS